MISALFGRQVEYETLFKRYNFKTPVICAVLAVCGSIFFAGAAAAEKIKNPIAVFSALDKITAVVTTIEVPINKTVKFGTLTVTPRVCYTRPPTETPRTTAFVEVNDVRVNGTEKRIFTGWMFASSPGLHAVEHPVYDVWLINCKTSPTPPSTAKE